MFDIDTVLMLFLAYGDTADVCIIA